MKIPEPMGLVVYTPYKRKGFSYQATITYEYKNRKGVITLTFGFITWYLLHLFHTTQELNDLVKERVDMLKEELKNG